MADQEQDGPEHQTTSAKLKRGFRDFLSNTYNNITFGKRTKAINVPLILMTSALAVGLGTAVVTDIDPETDTKFVERATPLSQNFNTGAQEQETEQGAVQSATQSAFPSVSILSHEGKTFGLVEYKGQYNLYEIDRSEDQWVLIENTDSVSILLPQIIKNLGRQQTARAVNFILSGSVNTQSKAYQINGDVSIPYAVEKDNGGTDIMRFGDVKEMELNLEEGYEYYKNAYEFWGNAQNAIDQGQYGIAQEDLPQYTKDEFSFWSNTMGTYSLSLLALYATVLGGGTTLAVGQTLTQGRRKRKKAQKKTRNSNTNLPGPL